MEITYPFEPKSAVRLRPGDFWPIPISGERFGCGRVIALKNPGQTGARSMLIAGLMNWIGSAPPTSGDLAGCRTVQQAQVHLRSILETGGVILGHRALALELIEPDLFLSEAKGANCWLMRGYEWLRPATPDEQNSHPVWQTWGYLIIRHRAEALAKSAA